uniref:Uncharacterized protein n=1 Tax=viral metagenome TaxID=1070528 RepID=A0A6C0LJS0_9ZZZZ
MFKYVRFDFINKQKKIKLLNIIIISFILIILYFNIHTKDDVKIISSNSKRILTTINNYTETMSEFINDNDELNEIKNIRLSINYFKELKQKEIKAKEQEEEELKQKEIKAKEQQIEELKKKELDKKKEKAINLIKSYVPNYNELINLVSSHSEINGYSNSFNCLKRLIKINNEELFNNLIKIDYVNNEVSFNYLDKNETYYKNTNNIIKSHLYTNYDENNKYYDYSHYIYRNYKENIIKNPIYQIIKKNLEIDYSYTEPNLTDYYNNKSRYFHQTFEGISDIGYNFVRISNTHDNIYKYYENYENDTYYLYYKTTYTYYQYSNEPWKEYIVTSFIEFLIENKIIINNTNSIDIYNKHPYKFICNIPSRSINNEPSISNSNKLSILDFHKAIKGNNHNNIFMNYINNNLNRLPADIYNQINTNNIEEILNIHQDKCNYDKYGYCNSLYGTSWGNLYYDSSYVSHYKYSGTRMVKHNLTNNMLIRNNIYYNYPYNQLIIINTYINKNIYINFPKISIYDEYEYIEVLLSNIVANIYNLPIIPPIKFIYK